MRYEIIKTEGFTQVTHENPFSTLNIKRWETDSPCLNLRNIIQTSCQYPLHR